MSKAKKKTKKQKQQTKFALRRLAEDEEAQAHLRIAAVRVREAWARASRGPASKAVEDKKIYDKVREAATSLTKAGQRLQPKPEPPKHNARKAALAAAGAGAAAYAVRKRRSRENEPFAAPGSSAHVDGDAAETSIGASG
jgi:hypothetical protein